ncbi:hypothetical protein BJ741DRAFT_603684 [Chytriomyces cf. hyalinus JEL632]|nr:hypothetical protein BJ741DRAFT_603684 [Chytriomyces cf. hyalinus JEL632]
MSRLKWKAYKAVTGVGKESITNMSGIQDDHRMRTRNAAELDTEHPNAKATLKSIQQARERTQKARGAQQDDEKLPVFRLLNNNQYESLLSDSSLILSPPNPDATISPIQHIRGGFSNADTQFMSFSLDLEWMLYYAYKQRWYQGERDLGKILICYLPISTFENPEFPETCEGDQAWGFYNIAKERLVSGPLRLPQCYPFEKKNWKMAGAGGSTTHPKDSNR